MFNLSEVLKEVFTASRVVNYSDDVYIESVDHDSRRIGPSSIYVAIKGANFDGHDFVYDAKSRGAVACLVERQIKGVDIPQIVVDDSVYCYGELARYWRRKNGYRIIAITGSNGKTTVKDILYTVFSSKVFVAATEANYNNLIGLPYTLLSFASDVELGIVELGMNKAGEIFRLAKISDPDLVLVNNVGRAHIGHLGSMDAILSAKMELFDYVLENKKKEAKFIVNLSDPMIRSWKGRDRITNATTYSCSKNIASDIKLDSYDDSGNFELLVKDIERVKGHTELKGSYNLCNICAAMAVAYAEGLNITESLDRLSSLKLSSMRSNYKKIKGIKYFIDCYNANPDSMESAIEAVNSMAQARKIAVVGDMMELGDFASGLHYEAGKSIAINSYDAVFAMGDYAKDYIDGFNKNTKKGSAFLYKLGEHDKLKTDLSFFLKKDDTVLLKASRAVKLELILDA